MNTFSKILFIVIVAIQLAVLGIMIRGRLVILETGTKVLLKCEPRDPRSLFSGDYVILNYEISRLSKNLIPDTELDTFKWNKPVYLALEKKSDNQYWSSVAVSQSLQTLQEKYPVIIKGRFKSKWLGSRRIHFGIEEYFVPQKQGLQIEKKMADVSVEVAITPDGENAISKLFIEGNEVQFK